MISRAEGCRLDLRRPVIRNGYATDLGFSDTEMDEFLAFLADPDQCGLIHYEDGIVTTDRTQEDHGRVMKRRRKDRDNYAAEKDDSTKENSASDSGKDTQHSTAEDSTQDNSSSNGQNHRTAAGPGPPAAAADFLDALQTRLLHHELIFDTSTLRQIAAVLERQDCADAGFVDFVVEGMAKRARAGRPIANPSGFFLRAVLDWPEWTAEWKRKRPSRIRCPDCGVQGGMHLGSCPRAEKVPEKGWAGNAGRKE